MILVGIVIFLFSLAMIAGVILLVRSLIIKSEQKSSAESSKAE